MAKVRAGSLVIIKSTAIWVVAGLPATASIETLQALAEVNTLKVLAKLKANQLVRLQGTEARADILWALEHDTTSKLLALLFRPCEYVKVVLLRQFPRNMSTRG